MAAPKALRISNMTCNYGTKVAVSNINFEVKKGNHVALLGPSGCGKTTILKAIVGAIRLTSGSINIDGKVVASETHSLSPESRRVGMVFQEHALFPHLSVEKNIAVGIRKKETSKRRGF